MSKPATFSPDYAVLPGDTLQETIDSLGLSQKELSERTGLSDKTINQIIKGVAPITAESALLFERVTGVPAAFWNNLEANYRERLARLQAKKEMKQQVQWVQRFSYAKMVELKFIQPAKQPVARVENLIRYFGVASSQQWETTYTELAGAAREPKKFLSDLGDLSAWLRAGEILAQKCNCADYDRIKFLDALQKIRKLTTQGAVQVWEQVKALCAGAGVAVVLVPELPKTHIYGFTRWLTPQKALIQLSLRYGTDDILWFTFFHEAAHILLHGKKDIFLECRGNRSEKEDEADQLACEALIPFKDWSRFTTEIDSSVSPQVIRRFANEQGVAASIVLGRLQHQGIVRQGYSNELKCRLRIVWPGLY